MTDDIALIDIREEVLRKIGRNVVNFQKMEAMLKFLNAQQAIRGSIRDLANVAAKAKKATSRQSMGQLAEAFLKSAYSSERPSREPESSDDVSVTFSFCIETDSSFAAERKKALRSVIRERNKLIHRRLASFNPNCQESCEALRSELDEQQARIWPEFEALRAVVTAIQEYQRDAAQYLASDAFLAELREHIASA